MLAAALERSPRAAAASSSDRRDAASTRHERRLALGQRAGLVDDERVDLLAVASSASAFLNSTPAVAPRPVADHDRHRRREAERARAGDDQHRDRVDERVREPRLRARRAPRRRRSTTAIDDHGRHEPRRRRGRRAAGSARGCAAPRRPCATICASSVSRADALGAHHEAAGAVDRAADDASRPASFSTGIGSPVSIDSSTALAPSSTTPSTGTFSPGRTRRRSPTWTCVERDVRFAAVVARSGARSSARGRAARGSRAPVAAARAQLEHLAEQHQRR